MNSAAYTSEQLAFAERVSRAMSNVPSDRQPMLETLVETLLAGTKFVVCLLLKSSFGS